MVGARFAGAVWAARGVRRLFGEQVFRTFKITEDLVGAYVVETEVITAFGLE